MNEEHKVSLRTVILGALIAASAMKTQASDIYISDAWLTNTNKSVALSVLGLSSADSFDIETCDDLLAHLWTPIFRHTYGYGYGYGYYYSGGYGYGYGFSHSITFGYGYGGGFEWHSDYTNASGRTFYRIKKR